MDFHRILILPWPPYTDAFKEDRSEKIIGSVDLRIRKQVFLHRFNPDVNKGGSVITGEIRFTLDDTHVYCIPNVVLSRI